MAPLPYVFNKIPNYRLNHTAVSLNAGPHPCLARSEPSSGFVPDLLGDRGPGSEAEHRPGRVLYQERSSSRARPETYRAQLTKAAELIDWKKNWHPRGQKARARSVAASASASTAGAAQVTPAKRRDHPSGWLRRDRDSARRIWASERAPFIAMVAAETLGLPMSMIKVKIGDNRLSRLRSFGRFHHRWRRVVLDAQSDSQCA